MHMWYSNNLVRVSSAFGYFSEYNRVLYYPTNCTEADPAIGMGGGGGAPPPRPSEPQLDAPLEISNYTWITAIEIL